MIGFFDESLEVSLGALIKSCFYQDDFQKKTLKECFQPENFRKLLASYGESGSPDFAVPLTDSLKLDF